MWRLSSLDIFKVQSLVVWWIILNREYGMADWSCGHACAAKLGLNCGIVVGFYNGCKRCIRTEKPEIKMAEAWLFFVIRPLPWQVRLHGRPPEILIKNLYFCGPEGRSYGSCPGSPLLSVVRVFCSLLELKLLIRWICILNQRQLKVTVLINQSTCGSRKVRYHALLTF